MMPGQIITIFGDKAMTEVIRCANGVRLIEHMRVGVEMPESMYEAAEVAYGKLYADGLYRLEQRKLDHSHTIAFRPCYD